MTTKHPMNPERRSFLKQAGLGLAGGALALGAPHAAKALPAELPNHPNFLIIITDQERYPQHWPAGWDGEQNLPGRWAIAQHGLTFQRNYCNSAMCSPSRACLFTGLFPAQHGLTRTLTYNGLLSDSEVALPVVLPNLARLLALGGYRVVYKGKWHLSKHVADDGLAEAGGPPTAADVAQFGFNDWEPTEAGEAAEPDSFGGGCANNDQIITDQAVAFLGSEAAAAQPFALVVSLANPHDVLAYPRTWDQDNGAGCTNYAGTSFNLGIDLPPTIDEDLSTKPEVQAESRAVYAAALGVLATDQQRRSYVNFYAQLHKEVDDHIAAIVAELKARQLFENTIIIRLADHGEMGLSHGGLRQKMFNAYEETVRVPLVISNPLLFPAPAASSALTSLVDLLPTIAGLAHISPPTHWKFAGKDLGPIITDARAHPSAPTATVQAAVLFTFDDDRSGTSVPVPQEIDNTPHHIRAMVIDDADGTWKIARYYKPESEGSLPEQYELYHLRHTNGSADDWTEINNLAGNPAYQTKFDSLLARLLQEENDRLFPVPIYPTYLPSLTR